MIAAGGSAGRVIEHHARHHRLIDVDAGENREERLIRTMFVKAYEQAAELVQGSATILDLGCNTGYGTALLRHATGAQVTGVDVSPAALAVARERYGGDFRKVDGRTLPFDDASMDAVTCMQVIEHIEDTRAFLAELRRVLRPGGPAVFTTPNAAVRLRPGQRPWNRFHVREYRAAELSALLSPFFSDVRVLGLFGTPGAEAVERARVARLRRIGRVRNALAWMVPLVVEDRVIRWVKRVAARGDETQATAGSAAPSASPEFSTSDLRYEPADLDRALDLMAVCR